MVEYDPDMVDWPPESETVSETAMPLSQSPPGPSATTSYQNGKNGQAVSQKLADPSHGVANPGVVAQGENKDAKPDPVQSVPPLEAPLPRPLDSLDVAAFIINKMIGTGIFTTPVTVLIKTHNDKGLALGLW